MSEDRDGKGKNEEREDKAEGGIRDIVDRAMEWLADLVAPTPTPVPIPVPVRRPQPRRR